MKTFKGPSGATVIALVALFISLGGGAYAATGLVGHNQLAPNSVWHNNIGNGSVKAKNLGNGSVGHSNLQSNSVWHNNIGTGSVQTKNLSADIQNELAEHGATGPQGPAGPQGPKGAAGQNGANPATAVINVPPVSSGENGAGGADSGQAGDSGFYFSGLDASGSAQLTGGELLLHGTGIDSNTVQGGIGIAKAFANVPLGNLNAVSYDWHVYQPNANQAPNVHLTVTGLVNNSRFANGFSNLIYVPALNGVTVGAAQQYHSDGFAPGARWFSSTNPTIGGQGGQNDPQPLSYFVGNNPNAVIGQISLDNGGASGATGTFTAGADNLILGFTGSPFARYDFGG